MKKIDNGLHTDFPPTIFYLDDLYDLVQFFKLHCKEIKIEAGDYRLESAEELSDLTNIFPKGQIPEIYISSFSPSIYINIQGYKIFLHTPDDSVLSLAFIQKVREISSRHKRIGYRLFTKYSHLLFVLPIPPMFIMGMTNEASILFLITLIYIGLMTKIELKNSIKIYAKKQSEMSSFFSRNKDEIYVSLISALAGSIITLVISSL